MTINIFRKTILLQIFLFLLAISLGITEGVLHGYEEVDSDITMTEGILFLFIILLLPFMWYFLYKLKPIGKKLFIFYLILGAISFFTMSVFKFRNNKKTSPYFFLVMQTHALQP